MVRVCSGQPGGEGALRGGRGRGRASGQGAADAGRMLEGGGRAEHVQSEPQRPRKSGANLAGFGRQEGAVLFIFFLAGARNEILS